MYRVAVIERKWQCDYKYDYTAQLPNVSFPPPITHHHTFIPNTFAMAAPSQKISTAVPATPVPVVSANPVDPVTLCQEACESQLATLRGFIDTQKSYITQMEALGTCDGKLGPEEHRIIKRAKIDRELLVLIKKAGTQQTKTMDKAQNKRWSQLVELADRFDLIIVKFVALGD